MQTRREVLALCKWIRMVISASPIERIRIICDDEYIGANISYDSIADHLIKKHAGSLRVVDFRMAYIGVHAAEALFKTCLQLEEFCISTGKNAVVKSLFSLRSDWTTDIYPHSHRLSSASVRQL